MQSNVNLKNDNYEKHPTREMQMFPLLPPLQTLSTIHQTMYNNLRLLCRQLKGRGVSEGFPPPTYHLFPSRHLISRRGMKTFAPQPQPPILSLSPISLYYLSPDLANNPIKAVMQACPAFPPTHLNKHCDIICLLPFASNER